MKNNSRNFLFVSGSGDTFVWFRLDLMKEIQNRGFNIYAAAPTISKENLQILKNHNICFLSLDLQRKSLNPLNFIFSIFSLRKVIKSLKPSHIFSYMHKSILATGLATLFFSDVKKYYMVTGLGHLFERNTFLMNLIQKPALILFKITFNSAKRIFFQNTDDFQHFLSLSLFPEAKGKIVNGSGVNLDKFKYSKLPSQPIFMTMGRLLESKGLREFARAAKIVKRSNPNARFLLYGYSDNHEDSIEESEITEHWKDNYGVEFLGFSQDPALAYLKCSIFVLLSYREGTPRSSLEAMAMGRPIITTNVPGCRETVINNKNGYLVAVKDHEEAAQAMIKLCDKDIREEMVLQSLCIAKDKFDVKKVNASVLECLELN
jgi:glycosyltransferase involved in cell wall biosynthesis